MDPLETQRLNGGGWHGAKLGALVCFALACALLAASLLMPQPTKMSSDGRLITGSLAQGR
jgi:hypothetical protein